MEQPTVSKGPAPPSPALEAFERELRQRYPAPWPINQYVLPRAVTECREVFIRELRSTDVIMAGQMADATMSRIEKSSVRLAREAETRESIRISIVGFGDALDLGDVTYRHVNHTPAPLQEINLWGKRLWDAFEQYYNDVNGLPLEEFLQGMAEARAIGAPPSPMSGTPASALHGRPGG